MVTVADIMQRDVTTVAPDTALRDVIRLLAAEGISGVPVVEAGGLVLGVVSATDLIRHAAREAEMGDDVFQWSARGPGPYDGGEDDEEPRPLDTYFLPEEGPFGGDGWDVGFEEVGESELTAEDLMTPATFRIPGEASLEELADFLVRGRIHRAVVTEDGRLRGIVTTMDVLAAIARGDA